MDNNDSIWSLKNPWDVSGLDCIKRRMRFFSVQAKMSFSLNIISFFWSLVAVILCALSFRVWSPDGSNLKVGRTTRNLWWPNLCSSVTLWMISNKFFISSQVYEGVKALIMVLLVVEKFIALFLIYWLSKAICREHFNTLVCHYIPHTYSCCTYKEKNVI